MEIADMRETVLKIDLMETSIHLFYVKDFLWLLFIFIFFWLEGMTYVQQLFNFIQSWVSFLCCKHDDIRKLVFLPLGAKGLLPEGACCYLSLEFVACSGSGSGTISSSPPPACNKYRTFIVEVISVREVLTFQFSAYVLVVWGEQLSVIQVITQTNISV